MSETFWDRVVDERQVGEEDDGTEWVEEPQPEQPEDTPVSQDTTSLLNLGKLVARTEIHGHEVVLRTLTIDEELEVGLLVHQYEGTDVWGRAVATANVAAAIETIDGKPLVGLLGPGENSTLRKFNYIRKNMYWPVIKMIYEEAYIPLLDRQVQSLDEFRKK
jgi:hypothetical protein